MPGTTSIDDEVRTDIASDDGYQSLVVRLSRQSVTKHFDAYADVDWDAPEMAIDAEEPRFELPDTDPLAATDWYRSQPPAVRARIGLHRMAGNMKVGLQFESVLQRGRLEYANRLPNGSPEFRYAYHEIVEEGHHSMMFQEFVNRSGIPAGGCRGKPSRLPPGGRPGSPLPRVVLRVRARRGRPIDFVQRSVLRSQRDLYPLLERIMRITSPTRRDTFRSPGTTCAATCLNSAGYAGRYSP